MPDWTPTLVEERLVEAATVLDRLPEQHLQGLRSTWPAVLQDVADAIALEPSRLRRPPPSAASITRMDEALQWLAWLDPIDARIVWLRASGRRWKAICAHVGLARTAAHEHWLYALCIVASRLSRRSVSAKRSRRSVIDGR